MTSEKLRIDKPRLICGILGEIAIREIPVTIARDDKREYSVSVRLALDIDAGFKKARIQLTDTEATTVFCKADYFGNTIFFTLTKDNESKTWPLPEFIEAERWYVPEMTLPQYEFPADIGYQHGGFMGFAMKLTPTSVVIAVDSSEFSPQQTEPFHITFRHRTKSEGLFHAVMELERIDHTDLGLDLTFSYIDSPADEQRIEHPVGGIGLDFETEFLGTRRLSGWIQLETLGLSGFSGKVTLGTPADFLPKGLIMNLKHPNIRFTLERESNGRCFFQVVDSGIDWWDFVQFHTDKRYGGRVATEHLTRLLTESGAIRGKRRAAFGKQIAEQIPFTGVNVPELSLRFTSFSEGASQPSVHRGLFRLTDHSYLAQEFCLGNFSSDDIVDIRNHSLQKLNEYRQLKTGLPRRYVSIYKPEIRRNADYLDSVFQEKNNTSLRAFAVKKSDVGKEPLTFLRSKNVDQLRQHERWDLSKLFHGEILSVLDFWNPTECNSLTNGLLKKLCRSYGTQLSLIETADSTPLGLVFQYHAWLATNASGILTASFVFPVRKISPEAMLHLVGFVAGQPRYVVGSNDMMVIGEPEEAANWQEILGRFSPYLFHSGIASIG